MMGLEHTFIPHATDSSVPSDHATVFSAIGLTLVFGSIRSVTGWAILLLGVCVAWSRVFLGVHFRSIWSARSLSSGPSGSASVTSGVADWRGGDGAGVGRLPRRLCPSYRVGVDSLVTTCLNCFPFISANAMLDYLVNLVGRLGQWGYLVIFLGAMLESAAFLGLIVPGESLVLVAGFLAAQGLLDLDVLIVTVATGAALGDILGYDMGRRLGRPALVHYGSHFGLTEARVDKADAFFARHGSKAIFLGRFVGFARAIVPFLAGSSKMPYRQFLS
jgi:membrane protein DedA with SNARE-associated domain